MPLLGISQSVLVGIRRQWVPTAIIAVAAVANITLDWILIPQFDAIGAAAANSTAQVLASIPMTMYAARCIGVAPGLDLTLLRGLAGAVIAGFAASVVINVLPAAPGVILGIVVFIAVSAPLLVLLLGALR